ncbi:phosphotransferase family protein [Paenibacillus contaminans]|nr:phosphotransferase [Paenibacillus contaminans]
MLKREAPPIELVKQTAKDCLPVAADRIERVLTGVSTYVYRVQSGENISYLRLLPEQENSFGVEVYVHNLLRQKGVQVPEVIYYEHSNKSLEMSMMLLNEIPGSDIGSCTLEDVHKSTLLQAGKHLAIVNQITVDGFGWIQRKDGVPGESLRAEKSSMHEYIFDHMEEDLFYSSENVFGKPVISRISSLLHAGAPIMARHEAHLAHGDFDDSHIFCFHGVFTGIIDFGEIQGSSPLYDLGHYKLHDGQRFLGFDTLAQGYSDIRKLSCDDQLEIDLWALWIGMRRIGNVCRQKRTWNKWHDHLVRTIRMEVEILSKKL